MFIFPTEVCAVHVHDSIFCLITYTFSTDEHMVVNIYDRYETGIADER